MQGNRGFGQGNEREGIDKVTKMSKHKKAIEDMRTGKEAPICYDFVDNAGYLVKAYKKRCSIYRKTGCYFVEETS